MAYGRLFEGTLDYAVDVSNGNRNGYVANQDSKFVSAFVNTRLFRKAEGSLLENLNIGGSMFTGNANQPVVPNPLRTAVAVSGNAVFGTPFLTFNNNVVERGNQNLLGPPRRLLLQASSRRSASGAAGPRTTRSPPAIPGPAWGSRPSTCRPVTS